ncbi:zinc finger protein 638 isoform X3 [Rana temporaria]|uniref:zinc finger protein 638 isoform X3 n=1 Tax=Rana temporaria TaxID=8407 RepID=UPI001AADA912|nr:zinc finger protein 638 isoform X3 [Rana temporaria]
MTQDCWAVRIVYAARIRQHSSHKTPATSLLGSHTLRVVLKGEGMLNMTLCQLFLKLVAAINLKKKKRFSLIGSFSIKQIIYFTTKFGQKNHFHRISGSKRTTYKIREYRVYIVRLKDPALISFVLFLENCAPVVNTLNFGISSPVLLNHPHLQLVHLKTQLALQQLTSVTSNSTPPIHALLNQALLKISTAQAMFNTRGGFPGQRPMGPPRMNQPGLNPLGMNMSGMNMSGMNMSAMGLSSMSQPSMTLSGMSQPSMTLSGMSQPSMNLSGMNLSGMNQPNMNTGMPRMGHPVINPNLGLSNVNPSGMNQSGMNQSGMNVFRMGPSGMNQGGMGFQSEIKNQGFGVRSMDSPGSFLGGNNESMGMTGLPLRTPERHMGPQGLPQRFPTSSSPMTPAQPRNNMQSQEIPSIVNRRVVHSSNNSRGNPKTSIPEASHLMEKKPINPLSMFGNLNQNMGIKSGPSSSLAGMPNVQNRYTNESASSILESFGLSNEDLEELSRYPDEQLTPVNLPNILRDIRLRKINRTGGTHDQGGGGGGRRSGGDVLPSKVIDYGHSSKFQFNDNSTPSRPFDSSRSEQKPSPVSKEPGPSNANKGGKGKNPMDNKIPTIANSRKGAWQTPKNDRFNKNKPLVGDQTTAKASGGSVTVSNAESPANAVKTVSTTLRNVPVISDTAATTTFSGKTAESPVGTVVSQGNYASPAEANPTAGKGSLAPPLSQEEAQKMKRMPTPSMMNDYFAASPRIFPHICSLCNLECRHLKDWIKHQNNASHIESCRKLRQQYPDWNPQVHTLNRNEGKQNEAAPKVSRSKSGSPRRAKRSGSRSRVNRSRSRSPRSAKLSRSRSPRRVRRSPRRSPGPRPSRRSPSPRRPRRGTPPDKRAVDAAVQSFIEAERRQDKGGEKPKAAGDVKKLPPKPANTNVKGKKPFGGGPSANRSGSTPRKNSNSSSSSYSKKPSSVSSVKSNNSSGSASRKPSNAPKKPLPSSSGPKKPVVSTGAKKTTGSVASKKPQANKTSNSPKAAEPFNPLNKFTSGSEKIIHVTNLPDSGYTDQDILKIVQPFGKVGDILIIRSKNEAFLETNFKEAAAAAVKFSETVPVMINGKRLVLSLAGRKKVQVKADTKATGDAESKKPPPQKAAPAKEQKDENTRKEEKETMEKKPETVKHNIEVPPGFVKCHRLVDPLLKEAEKCVVVVSNLPEKQYTVEEISNLAKPFGGVNDILVIPNYRKAYLELTSRNSLDSMLKFYSVFPTCLAGNTLNIAMAPAFKDLKDENRIFAEIIEQASCKITPSIYERFVHLSNLPEGEIEEFELTRIGLRFGKVEHYIVISNRRKAILHMTSFSAAKSMHAVLSRFPGRIEDTVLKCSLVFKAKLPENEYETYLEEKKSSEPDQNICEEVAPNLDEEMQLEEQQQPVSDADIAEADVEAAGVFTNEEAEEVEDDDDYEEAAEAPEAPEAPASFIQPQPVEEQPICSSIAQPYVTEESDVLVSVESDEEECEEQCPEIPVIDSVSMEHMLTAEDSEESDGNDMETSTKEMSGDCPKPVEEASAVDDQNIFALDDWISVEVSQVPETVPEPTNKESEGSTAVIGSLGKEETSSVKAEESSDKEAKPESGRSPRDARSKENGQSNEDKSKQKRERSKQSSHGKNGDEAAGEDAEEPQDSEQAAMATKVPATRTAKFNPQKGELSVTLTVDGQKSSSKTPEPRKKYSGDRGSSGRESSTPKSSSNRSSPSESVSSNPKTATASHQTRSGHRGVGTQDRDSKVPSRARDVDVRSNRKDDRSKDSPVCFESVGDGIGESNQSTGDTSISQSLIKNSSSGRWVRNSARKNRGQKSNEEGEEPFPFNLDEFVTVDEIVEDNPEKPKGDEEKSETGATKRGEKRKENHPPSSDTKKPKEASGEAQELSFVTLDEVGDEEDNAATSEGAQDEVAQSLVTVDEVHAEDKVQAVDKVKAGNGPPSRTQESSVLMTLDEVSDDEEPNGPAMPGGSSTILDKDQLLTLDEVSGEDEEQTSHSEPSIHKTENKGEKKSANPKTKENPDVRPQEPDRESHAEQPMLTLDEVVADDDDDEEEDSIGDIEHQFLTVDEVGEEEEDSEVKEDVAESKPQSSRTSSRTSPKVSQPESKTPAGRRGRPRKRPLSESAEDAKDTSLQSSVDSSMGSESDKTPTKTKPKTATKGADHGKAGGNPTATPEKPSAGAPKASETPAKKTKLESPSPGKTKLGPFNATVPVGLEFLIPKTGYFCELCSLFYMDEASKLKHCKSLRHYQTVQKHLAKDETTTTKGKSPSS